MFMTDSKRDFLKHAFWFQACLALIAITLGVFSDIDPLQTIRWDLRSILLGILHTIPMLIVFGITFCTPFKEFQDIKFELREFTEGYLQETRWYELAILSLWVGITEEVLFRGLIQVWFHRAGFWIGLVGCNLIFAFLHYLSFTYAMLAFILGAWISWIFYSTGTPNLTIAIIAHAVYDFIAFMVIRHSLDKSDELMTLQDSVQLILDRSEGINPDE